MIADSEFLQEIATMNLTKLDGWEELNKYVEQLTKVYSNVLYK